MASSIAASAEACRILTKARLTFEPAMMVNAREELSPPIKRILKRLELSNLDQVFDFYSAIALFYATPPQSSVNVGGVLRSALEELLAHYPWAAGRLRVNKEEQRQEVEYCNGKGVQFVVAHADLMFSDLGDVSLPHPSLDLLFPSVREAGDGDPPIVAIQVTRFKCGGFILSLMNHHAVMDGHSAAVFLQNLCSIARGAGLVVLPDQVSRRERMKPSQLQITPSPTFQYPHIPGKLLATTLAPLHYGSATRYSFSANALEILRRRALSGHQLLFTACSRYQALAALLWIARAKSLLGGRLPPGHELPLRMPVNIRVSSIIPTITRGYVGNAVYYAIVCSTVHELIERPLGFHVHKIKLAIANVMPEYVQSQLDNIEVMGRHILHDESFVTISSLVNLPFFDTDCGWGCPVYCGRPNWQLSNRLIILDGRGSWNVLVVFASDEERILFQDVIEEYITVS